MSVTVALFLGAIAMGVAGAFIWAWAVHSGQFSDLERTKEQLFWPEMDPGGEKDAPTTQPDEPPRNTSGGPVLLGSTQQAKHQPQPRRRNA